MAYEVIARKWRPKQFDEVVGQEHVTQTLRNAIKTGRIAHAYLLVGPRGIGKTSIARILAKALNCVTGPTETPCDKCASCVEIAAGTNLDVVEIDGASTRGIDDVKALRESVKYAPYGRFKIHIIDEVHALTAEAFNALLKTLEEPPPRAKFIFATTEAHKIPLTILSRCQRFDLRRLTNAQIINRLAEIAASEGVAVEPGALDAIARASEGGLRDAESALDQLIAFRGKQIAEKDVLSVFGLISRPALESLSTAILKGDIAAAMRAVEEFDATGKNMSRLAVELLEHYRNVAVFLQIGDAISGLETGACDMEALKKQAALTDIDRVLRIMDILTESAERINRALSKRTFLETALLRCARAATTVSLDELILQVKSLAAEAPAAETPPQADASERSGLLREQPPQPAQERAAPQNNAAPAAPHQPVPSQSLEKELEALTGAWHALAEKIGKISLIGKRYFLDSKPARTEKDRVIIGLDPEFAETLETIRMPRNQDTIQSVISEFLGRPVGIEFTVLKNDEAQALPADHKVPQKSAEKKSPQPPATGKTGASKPREPWTKQESVRLISEIFKASVIDVRA